MMYEFTTGQRADDKTFQAFQHHNVQCFQPDTQSQWQWVQDTSQQIL